VGIVYHQEEGGVLLGNPIRQYFQKVIPGQIIHLKLTKIGQKLGVMSLLQ